MKSETVAPQAADYSLSRLNGSKKLPDKDSKRLLVIAYAFPPCGGAGVQRTTKFVQYLPEYGWLPTVVTVDAAAYGMQDTSHLNEIPAGIEVLRTFHFDPVARLSPPLQITGGIQPTQSRAPQRSLEKIFRSAAKALWVNLERHALIPDRTVIWCPPALLAGLRACRRQRFDLIYVTGEPYSAYFTARGLSRLTGVPYVLDMRDPWTLAPYRLDAHSPFRQALERRQEQRALATCRAGIFANRSVDLYTEAFPQWAAKFHYIPNGYDSADFAGVEPKRFDKFTIVHSGTFLPGYRTADTFLLALRELLSRRPELAQQLQVQFVGKIGEEKRWIQELNLASVVKQTGYLPHRESVSYLLGADLLLLIGGNHHWEETGKIYEYFAAGKPILALVRPDGAAAELLRQYSAAQIVDRQSIEDASAALVRAISSQDFSNNVINRSWSMQFERKQQTGRLAEILNGCLDEKCSNSQFSKEQ